MAIQVDDLVARLFETVAVAGAMDRTVFIYSSDHGYHSGQWGVAYCKMLPCVLAAPPYPLKHNSKLMHNGHLRTATCYSPKIW